MAYDDLASLSNLQSGQAQFFGNEAAKVADPYGYKRRVRASKSLDRLLANPGGINSSPFYKYLAGRAMAATRAGNAAGGFRNSGRGLMALQDAAQGAATKAFFPLAELYGKISGATNNLSPVAASLALSGSERSQDYAQMGAAARALAERQAGAGTMTPAWMQGLDEQYSRMFGDSGGGGSLPYSAPSYGTWAPSYMPSSGAGTGYMTSDSGTTAFSPSLSNMQAGGGDWSVFDPNAFAEQDYWGYS